MAQSFVQEFDRKKVVSKTTGGQAADSVEGVCRGGSCRHVLCRCGGKAGGAAGGAACTALQAPGACGGVVLPSALENMLHV